MSLSVAGAQRASLLPSLSVASSPRLHLLTLPLPRCSQGSLTLAVKNPLTSTTCEDSKEGVVFFVRRRGRGDGKGGRAGDLDRPGHDVLVCQRVAARLHRDRHQRPGEPHHAIANIRSVRE